MRIQEIKLLANRLEPVKQFYHGLFDLPMMHNSDTSVSFQAGTSILTFDLTTLAVEPFYHFAFNITETKMDQAVEWLKAKGVLITLVDEYSESWNSDSVYFYDPIGNIVEFIARHNLKSSSDRDFSFPDILNISEIGLVAEDVTQLSAYLQDLYKIPAFRAGSATFKPMGDEEGLMILASVDRVWFGSDKKSAVYPVQIVMENGKAQTRQLLNYPYTITAI